MGFFVFVFFAPSFKKKKKEPLPPQGPCTGNQQSLAHSRLWDAIVGFLHVFAHMMMKLAQVRSCHLNLNQLHHHLRCLCDF